MGPATNGYVLITRVYSIVGFEFEFKKVVRTLNNYHDNPIDSIRVSRCQAAAVASWGVGRWLQRVVLSSRGNVNFENVLHTEYS